MFMAVLPMKQVAICALKKDRKPILELLQRLGTVQVEDGDLNDEVFSKQDRSEAEALFQKNAQIAAHALDVLNAYVPAESSLAVLKRGRKAVTIEEYNARVQDRKSVV